MLYEVITVGRGDESRSDTGWPHHRGAIQAPGASADSESAQAGGDDNGISVRVPTIICEMLDLEPLPVVLPLDID